VVGHGWLNITVMMGLFRVSSGQCKAPALAGVVTMVSSRLGQIGRDFILDRCFSFDAAPPLFFPWHDLSVKEAGVVFKSVDFRFQRIPSVRVNFSQKLSQHLAEVAGDAWPELSDFSSDR